MISRIAVTALGERSAVTVKTAQVVKAVNKKKSFGFLVTMECGYTLAAVWLSVVFLEPRSLVV